MTVQLTIQGLNDLFRTTFLTGTVVLTEGIQALEHDDMADVITRVREFKDFTADNDPYGEHDFGAFDHPVAGKVFWKIDYYDPTLTHGSEDAADPRLTKRVLTIMLAREY
jgi:hypothetical protein